MAFTTCVRGMLSTPPKNACMGSDSTLPRWLLLRRLRGLLAGTAHAAPQQQETHQTAASI
jgi:hypothetical protein